MNLARRVGIGADDVTNVVDPLDCCRSRSGNVDRGVDPVGVYEPVLAGGSGVVSRDLTVIVDPDRSRWRQGH